MAYIHEKPIVPHNRTSAVRVGDRFIRPGSWGSMPAECKLIELFMAGGGPCGPFTVDHIPSTNPKYPDGIWKVFYNDEAARYADREDINTMVKLVRGKSYNDLLDFVTLDPVLMFSSKGQYDSDEGLDDAFGLTPTEDGLSDAFGVAPVGRPKQPRRKENALAEWSEIILGPSPDNDPFGGAFDEEPSEDWEEAFS